jgi:hypothetical protein
MSLHAAQRLAGVPRNSIGWSSAGALLEQCEQVLRADMGMSVHAAKHGEVGVAEKCGDVHRINAGLPEALREPEFAFLVVDGRASSLVSRRVPNLSVLRPRPCR